MNDGRYRLDLDPLQRVKLPNDILKQAGWYVRQRLYVRVDGGDVVLSPCNDLCRWCGEDDPRSLLAVDEDGQALICDRCMHNALRTKIHRDNLDCNDALSAGSCPAGKRNETA